MQQLHESKSVELEAKLGKGRREWQSKILSQSPYRVPGSSATNAQRPAKAYQSPKTPSPHPPGNVKMVHLFEREVSVKNRIRCIRISPDGSCFTLFDGSGTVLIATDTGKDLNHYGNSLRPVGFSSGGGILALWDGEFLHKALLDRSTGRRYLRQWQRLNIRKPWTAISEDFETVVDTLEERLALTSLATGKSYKLEWTTESSEMGARGLKFCFAKHDELLVCCGRQSLYFFETRTRRLLRMERILGLATHGAEEKTGDYTYALSGDTLSLGVIAFPFRDVSDTDTVFVSFFRLSGMCPELMSTFQHPCGWRQRLSLSFDGRYIALPNSAESRFDIAHTMSGRIVLSQEVDGELLDLRFFPSDNRFMWLTKKGSYHVARLID
ncbi:hypothetical protein F5B18DRAFT_328211 [Nemania serpens]|nr:hypothetical protein F5B18DRAFT_328211 [Nemania serpens]